MDLQHSISPIVISLEKDRKYDVSADIWSFGITTIEVLTGEAPYEHFTAMKVIKKTLSEPPPTLPDNLGSKSFRDLVEQCLQKDPAKRLI